MLILLLFVLRKYCTLVVALALPAALVTLFSRVPLTVAVCAKLVLACCSISGVLTYYELKRTEVFVILDNLRISRFSLVLATGIVITSATIAFVVWLLPRH